MGQRRDKSKFAHHQIYNLMKKSTKWRLLSLSVLLAAGAIGAQAAQGAKGRSKDAPALWGQVSGSDVPTGLYSFDPASAPVFQPLCESVAPSAIVDGKLYSFYTNNDNPFDVRHYYMVKDIRSWETIESGELENSFLVPAETAQDQINGKVYGQFRENGSIQIACLDPAARTKTVIGIPENSYVALGVTSQGVLYGISYEGNLYRISTEDCKETLIGSTGVSLKVEGFQTYMTYSQSGEIDQTTDKFYWASKNGKGDSVLYEVSLADASLTKVADLQRTVISSMMIPLYLAEDLAPGQVSGARYDFKESALDGTIGFTVPAASYSGEKLSGMVTYTVKAGDAEVGSGSASPGETVSLDATLPKGQSRIVIALSNEAGHAYPYSQYHWAGYDEPEQVTGLQLAFDQDKGEASMSWSAPTRGLHSGYMGPLAYNVYRMSKAGTELVAEGISDTSFAEVLEPGGILKSISYGVEPVNGDMTGARSQTRGFMWGTPNVTPWSEDFASQESFDLWTVEDTNGDRMSWSCIPYFQAVYSGGSNGIDCDDWLISPPIRLEEDKNYRLKYNASNDYAAYGYVQKLEIRLGQGTGSESMTRELKATYEVGASTELDEVVFSVEKDGTYNVGFHDVSPADMYQLSLSSVTLEELSGDEAPAAVTDLEVHPGEEGAYSVSLSFKAPTLNKKGEALGSIDKIEVSRGNDLVKTFEAPAPGESLEYVDSRELKNGNYDYTVIAYNDNGPGEKQTRTLYVGLDRPQSVNGIEVDDNRTSVDVRWQPVGGVGINGGYVNPADVVYDIYEVDSDNVVQRRLGTTSETGYTIECVTDEGEQAQSRWSVVARNATGSDPNSLFADNSVTVANVKLITGAPYMLPYEEHFTNQSFAQYCWREHTSYRLYTAFASGMSSDGDGVSLAFTVYELGEGTDGHFTTGKLSMAGCGRPCLEFDYYFVPGLDMRYEVSVIDDGQQTHRLGTIDYSVAGNEGWKTAKYELPEGLLSSGYVMARIHAYINDMTSPMLVDNVRVYDSTVGIGAVGLDEGRPASVYTLQGFKVNVSSVEELDPGIYIIDGKKVHVR